MSFDKENYKDIKYKEIVGILVFSTKYKYGYNKRHSELFLFKPLSKRFPEFLVASKNRYLLNQYAVIKFLSWENKLPYGEIIKIIGDTDDEICTYEAIIYKNNLNTVITKYNKSTDFNINFDNLPHKNFVDKYVFSVDPKGCEDIDDAFSITLNNGFYTVDIHIADVSYYIDYFNIEVKRFSTIYCPNKNYSMLPDIFANNICSLKEGQDRLAFTVSVNIDLSGKIINYSFEKTVIRSKKAYSYEEFDCNLESEKLLYDLGEKIYFRNNYDSHKMVEVFMVMANHLVAKTLYENIEDKSKIIFRIHEKKELDHLINHPNKEINDILELLESNAAIYTNINTNSNYQYYHYGLGIEYYTHFTSPIRRYVDIYIHKLLNSVINNKNYDIVLPDCAKINEYDRNIKKINRDFNKLLLAQKYNNEIIEAYILKIENNKITLYIPENKIIHQIKIIDRQLKDLFNLTVNKDSTIVTHKISNKSVTLKIYDKVKIKIESKMYQDYILKKIDMYVHDIIDLLNV